MSKKANPKLIGAFVVGGIALAVGVVAVFATGRFFQETEEFVVFFDQSVQGLQVGAPVGFRGVQVGAVTKIVVEYNLETDDIRVPVIFELFSERIQTVGTETRTDAEQSSQLIERGLRAQLQVQSLVTGQQTIQLDFFPGAPLTYAGGVEGIEEFPAIPSSMAQIQDSIEDLAAGAPELIAEGTRFLASAGQVIDDRNKTAFANILSNVEQVSAEMADSDHGIGSILNATEEMLTNLEAASASIEEIANNVVDGRENIENAVAQIGNAGEAVTRMADQMNNLLAENRTGLQDFTNEGLYEITGLAQDGQDMFDQISRVFDEIERDAPRFLFGDRQQGVDTR